MIWKLVAGLASITTLSVSLYLSPLRGNAVAVVGVFALLSALIIAVLTTTDIEILTVEKKPTSLEKIPLKEKHMYKTVSNTAKFLDLSHTDTRLRKTTEFEIDIYSSENQITLSSH